jgi:alkylhydroperoxidase family enzyme
MARIPYVEEETAPEEVRKILERLPVKLNIFKLMAHAETSFRPLLSLGTSILSQHQLSAKMRELAILRVARLSGAEYEWVQHVPIAIGAGASEAQVAALQADAVNDVSFDPVERLVLAFTTEVVERVGATEATFREMEKHFSSREIVELVLAIGFYMTVARLMETMRIDLEPAAGTAVIDSLRR